MINSAFDTADARSTTCFLCLEESRFRCREGQHPLTHFWIRTRSTAGIRSSFTAGWWILVAELTKIDHPEQHQAEIHLRDMAGFDEAQSRTARGDRGWGVSGWTGSCRPPGHAPVWPPPASLSHHLRRACGRDRCCDHCGQRCDAARLAARGASRGNRAMRTSRLRLHL